MSSTTPRARGARPASPVTPSARVALDGGRQVDFRRRRLVFVLVVLVLISVVIGLGGVWLGEPSARRCRGGSTSSSPSASPSGTVPYTIADLHDFDPSADGGNNQENPNELGRAVDGNPSTAWHTLTYLNNPRLGGLKPGVGIVLNLGKPEAIGSVKLTLQGKPTARRDPRPEGQVTQAPMSSVKDWTVVAKNAAADTDVTLTPTFVGHQPVGARLPHLPPEDRHRQVPRGHRRGLGAAVRISGTRCRTPAPTA